ncbi:4-hydroxythreonine-4-phosphate dehydrogenase PdxA [Hymenobacter sp. BT186]|uniref:4-hydroxythreonine-4-phosphate dehydrogenase PdxA n=1 Tax=Hymenobacter telluris TaxID=2816474 RepID=A0A939F0Q4_9BACT|nr:4-hydroxythreonine-4-phosphate dehydrogenase PdxA [Hymenobacter telluris]MBO0361005.1 4-hydroxythreonine-4-phosphate dehydrogenase PdxA [Hymenobacter telluris]MBW3377033.1 4-hydroxythreonine-4-phosphate dehydrogenase PdxA [Hymenobacter norwichensis]
MLPRIGISVGDLAGIGPEIIYKTFLDARLLKFCTPVVYGTATVLFDDFPVAQGAEPLTFRQVREAADIAPGKHNAVTCWEDDFTLTPGQPSTASGTAARQSLLAASRDLKAGLLDALVTAPISKENTQADDFRYPGHTEFLTNFFGASESLMLLASEELRVATATGHIPLKDVSSRVTKELLLNKLRILLKSLKKDFGIEKPRVAVLGMNPHAGENGLLGTEEQDVVIPVVQQLLQEGHLVFGPYPADGYFGTRQYRQFDATLSLYHDQGLIPFKSIAFERGVNFTAGLSVIRTSPDHGTAYGIAGQYKADETSFREALYLACELVRQRAAEAAIKPLIPGVAPRGGRHE